MDMNGTVHLDDKESCYEIFSLLNIKSASNPAYVAEELTKPVLYLVDGWSHYKRQIFESLAMLFQSMRRAGLDFHLLLIELISRNLISRKDVKSCIKIFRKEELKDLIPILILHENGEIGK
jgi:hypothetical protein